MAKKRKIPNPKRKYEFLSVLKRKSVEETLGFRGSNLAPFFNDHIVFENGYHMSIQCSAHSYSTPRKNLENLKDYTAFEVALFDRQDNWIIVKIPEFGTEWYNIYEGYTMKNLFENIKLENVNEGHIIVEDGNGVAGYVSRNNIELLYQYLKRQKRKFVIIEKYKKHKYEEQD